MKTLIQCIAILLIIAFTFMTAYQQAEAVSIACAIATAACIAAWGAVVAACEKDADSDACKAAKLAAVATCFIATQICS